MEKKTYLLKRKTGRPYKNLCATVNGIATSYDRLNSFSYKCVCLYLSITNATINFVLSVKKTKLGNEYDLRRIFKLS